MVHNYGDKLQMDANVGSLGKMQNNAKELVTHLDIFKREVKKHIELLHKGFDSVSDVLFSSEGDLYQADLSVGALPVVVDGSGGEQNGKEKPVSELVTAIRTFQYEFKENLLLKFGFKESFYRLEVDGLFSALDDVRAELMKTIQGEPYEVQGWKQEEEEAEKEKMKEFILWLREQLETIGKDKISCSVVWPIGKVKELEERGFKSSQMVEFEVPMDNGSMFSCVVAGVDDSVMVVAAEDKEVLAGFKRALVEKFDFTEREELLVMAQRDLRGIVRVSMEEGEEMKAEGTTDVIDDPMMERLKTDCLLTIPYEEGCGLMVSQFVRLVVPPEEQMGTLRGESVKVADNERIYCFCVGGAEEIEVVVGKDVVECDVFAESLVEKMKFTERTNLQGQLLFSLGDKIRKAMRHRIAGREKGEEPRDGILRGGE